MSTGEVSAGGAPRPRERLGPPGGQRWGAAVGGSAAQQCCPAPRSPDLKPATADGKFLGNAKSQQVVSGVCVKSNWFDLAFFGGCVWGGVHLGLVKSWNSFHQEKNRYTPNTSHAACLVQVLKVGIIRAR